MKHDVTSLDRLCACVLSDLDARFNILYQELRHLQEVAASYQGNRYIFELLANEEAVEKNCDFRAVVDDWKLASSRDAANDDTAQFLRFIIPAAQLIKQEIKADRARLRELRDGSLPAKIERLRAGKDRLYEEELAIHRYTYFLNVVLRYRAGVYARRVGDLHDRLEQEFEHVNPLGPAPTVRRRHEDGFGDKYMNELSRWGHRDIIVLLRDVFGARYPYHYTPVTFQFWGHDDTSRNSAFVPDFVARAERNWILASGPDCSHAYIDGQNNEFEMLEFAVSKQSYWMSERPALHPILGHELAHIVIRASFGREIHRQAIGSKAAGDFGRLFRIVSRIFEASVRGVPSPKTQVPLEISCDILAATHYGHAYLYAWLLETLSSDHQYEVSQFNDEFNHVDLSLIEEVLEGPTRSPFLWIPTSYLRGCALVAWLGALNLEGDPTALALRVAVRAHLELSLKFRFSHDKSALWYWSDRGRELEKAIVASGIPQRVGARLRLQRRAGGGSDTFRERQRLGGAGRRWVEQTFPWAKYGWLNSGNAIQYPWDLPWRAEWRNHELLGGYPVWMDKPLQPSANGGASERNPAKHGRDREATEAPKCESRYLTGTKFYYLVENYLYRTANPARLREDAGSPEQNGCSQSGGVGLNTTKGDEYAELLNLALRRTTYRDVGNRNELRLRVDKGLPAHMHGLRLTYSTSDIDRWFGEVDCRRLDLMVINIPAADRVNCFGDYHRYDCGWGAYTGYQKEFKNVTTKGLLGRYDRFCIESLRGEFLWGGSEETVLAPKPCEKPCQKRCEHIPFVPYSARRRLMRRVAIEVEVDERPKDGYLLIIAGLKWSGLRLPMLEWLERGEGGGAVEIRESLCDAFLSNGWEDLVLILDPDSLDKAFVIINSLHDHPFVAGTESIFTQDVQDHVAVLPDPRDHLVRLSYQIRVRRTVEEFLGELRAKEPALTSDVGIRIRRLPMPSWCDIGRDEVAVSHELGSMDFTVYAPYLTGAQHIEFGRFLHEFVSISRIETKVRKLESLR